jgi:hypothetical protein
MTRLPPPGRDQLMRPPESRPLKTTENKKTQTEQIGPRRRALSLEPSPFLLRSRPRPAHTQPPSALRSSSLSPDSSPPDSSSLNRLPLRPIFVVARNSRIAAVYRSSPNSCAIEVFLDVRFPPVALPIARHIVICWSLQRWQCLKRCARVCDGPDPPFEHHQH